MTYIHVPIYFSLLSLLFTALQASDQDAGLSSILHHAKQKDIAQTVLTDLHKNLCPPTVSLVVGYLGNGVTDIDLQALYTAPTGSFGIYKIKRVENSEHAVALKVCFVEQTRNALFKGTFIYDHQTSIITPPSTLKYVTNYKKGVLPLTPIRTRQQLFQDKCSIPLPKFTFLQQEKADKFTILQPIKWVSGKGASKVRIARPYAPEVYLANALTDTNSMST